ncbi:hypothetical protein F4W66_24225 (plasmid) [Escherichia coli]|nr:hypothetical protein F4W66_24225 [Escherichia coli]
MNNIQMKLSAAIFSNYTLFSIRAVTMTDRQSALFTTTNFHFGAQLSESLEGREKLAKSQGCGFAIINATGTFPGEHYIDMLFVVDPEYTPAIETCQRFVKTNVKSRIRTWWTQSAAASTQTLWFQTVKQQRVD